MSEDSAKRATRHPTTSSGTEEALRDSQTLLSGIIESAMDAIITVDADQCILLFNQAAERMFRTKAVDAVGQPLDRFIPDRFRHSHKNHIDNFGRTGVATRAMGKTQAVSGLRSDGEEFPVEASISQVEIGGRKLYTVILRDITERKHAETELKRQAEIIDLAPVMVRDTQDRIILWNTGSEQLYGYSRQEALGKVSHQLLETQFPAPMEEIRMKLFRDGKWEGELIHAGLDGSRITVVSHWILHRDQKGASNAILEVNTDVTEKKRIEAQLLRSQRMESIGTLAGGIAHDLNNVLSPVMMALEVLQMRHTDEESRAWLKILDESVKRGAGMVKQVLSFARGTGEERVLINPKHLLSEMINILRETFPKSIEIKFNLQPALWAVKADTTGLNQVLMNLCVNARDAMPAGGVLMLSAENVTLDENYARMTAEATAGDYVKIKVEDSGEGIAAELRERIFDPFFTTKDVGKGTGLGLSTALAIVKSHQGFINVYSEAGRGSFFSVYLPAADRSEEKSVEKQVEELPVGCGQLILVVDDEEAVREITKGTLETFGYQVLTAADGTEAVATYAQRKSEVALVITDMMMPFMDGLATIRALKRLNPQVKIISASGLADDAKEKEARELGVEKFLPKPYTAELLLYALAEILQNQ